MLSEVWSRFVPSLIVGCFFFIYLCRLILCQNLMLSRTFVNGVALGSMLHPRSAANPTGEKDINELQRELDQLKAELKDAEKLVSSLCLSQPHASADRG